MGVCNDVILKNNVISEYINRKYLQECISFDGKNFPDYAQNDLEVTEKTQLLYNMYIVITST